MARLQLSKSALSREQKNLATYQKFLPSLDLKRQQSTPGLVDAVVARLGGFEPNANRDYKERDRFSTAAACSDSPEAMASSDPRRSSRLASVAAPVALRFCAAVSRLRR